MNEQTTLDLELEELELSVKYFMELREMGFLVVGDLASFSEQELRERVRDDDDFIHNVRRALAGAGVFLKGDTGVRLGPDQPVPEETWGCLYIFDDEDGAYARVLARVVRAYLSMGLELAEDNDMALMPVDDPELNTDELGPDEVLVIEQEAEGWYAILSAYHEWSRPGQHPLAQLLSLEGQVVSITSAAGWYSEIALYKEGGVEGISLIGRSVPLHGRLRGTPIPLDLQWFAARDALEGPAGLYDILGDLDAFGSITGCEERGFREALRERGLHDTRDALLLFL